MSVSTQYNRVLDLNNLRLVLFKGLPKYLPFIYSIFHCFQSPDGKFIACGAIDGIINIFDIATGKLVHTLEGTVLGTQPGGTVCIIIIQYDIIII